MDKSEVDEISSQIERKEFSIESMTYNLTPQSPTPTTPLKKQTNQLLE